MSYLRNIICVLLLGVIMTGSSSAAEYDAAQNAYAFSFAPLQGSQPVALVDFKGKVIMVVNTASQCGFTGQYDGLEKLYNAYKDRGLVLVGVPSDDFGHQESGSNDDIAHFCKLNYGVSFPMAAKQHVTGSEAHPFYQWVRTTLGLIAAPKWNFHKLLIDRDGKLVDYFYSTTAPDNKRLIAAVEKYLAQPHAAGAGGQ